MGNFANEKKKWKKEKNRGSGNHLTRSHSSVFEQPHLLLVQRRCFFSSFFEQQVHQQQVYPSMSGNRPAYELWTMLWAESLKSPAHHRWEEKEWGERRGRVGWQIGNLMSLEHEKTKKLLLQTTLLIALEKRKKRVSWNRQTGMEVRFHLNSKRKVTFSAIIIIDLLLPE